MNFKCRGWTDGFIYIICMANILITNWRRFYYVILPLIKIIIIIITIIIIKKHTLFSCGFPSIDSHDSCTGYKYNIIFSYQGSNNIISIIFGFSRTTLFIYTFYPITAIIDGILLYWNITLQTKYMLSTITSLLNQKFNLTWH